MGYQSVEQSNTKFDSKIQDFSKSDEIEKKMRILSILSYFGLAPLLYFSAISRPKNDLLKHHSLGFVLLIFFAMVIYEIFYIPAQFVNAVLWKPTYAEYLEFRYALLYSELAGYGIAFILVCCCIFAYSISIIGAWLGRTPQFFILSKLFSKPYYITAGVYWYILVEVLLVIIFLMGIHSINLSKHQSASEAKVYVLYTIGGYIPLPGLVESFTPPNWFMTLGFYPLVNAGIEKFGEDGAAVLPLTEENFRQAISKGEFIFIASHGGIEPGSFSLSVNPPIQYAPSSIDPTAVGDDLQFVYFSGCFTGNLANEWKEVLRIDDAILFDRLSSVDEHMLWAWFKSPAVIKNLQ